MGCSLPGSSVRGIFQARVLGWDAVAFSNKSLLEAVRVGGKKKKTAEALRMSTKDVTYSVSNQNISLIESICGWKDQ